MSGIAEVLDSIFRRIDPQDRRRVYRVWRFWAEEVGEAIAARAEPAGYHAGVLSVRVTSHAWMQELQFLKESIRERLNGRIGEELIRDIYFVSASGEKPTPRHAPQQPAREGRRTRPIAVPPLADPRLGEVFERLVRAHADHARPARHRRGR